LAAIIFSFGHSHFESAFLLDRILVWRTLGVRIVTRDCPAASSHEIDGALRCLASFESAAAGTVAYDMRRVIVCGGGSPPPFLPFWLTTSPGKREELGSLSAATILP
jgi:hypothetical protein